MMSALADIVDGPDISDQEATSGKTSPRLAQAQMMAQPTKRSAQPQTEATMRSASVLARARTLVLKAAMVEQSKVAAGADLSERAEDAVRAEAQAARAQMLTESRDRAARASGHAPDEGGAPRGGAGERAGGAAKKPALKKPAGAGSTGSTGFLRYRRTSAYMAEAKESEKMEKKAKAVAHSGNPAMPRARRLSVGWADLGGLFDGLGQAKSAVADTAAGPAVVLEQSAEWWVTDSGKRFVITYNTLTIDRIHLRLAESKLVPLLMVRAPHSMDYPPTRWP